MKYIMIILLLFPVALMHVQHKPALYLIGDSTVRNDDSTGHRGWGSYIGLYPDTQKITVSNQAIAGRSTRTLQGSSGFDVLNKLSRVRLSNYNHHFSPQI